MGSSGRQGAACPPSRRKPPTPSLPPPALGAALPRTSHLPCPAPALLCPVVQQDRKPSPLQRGGTLQGEAAAGKDASEAFKKAVTGAAASGPTLQVRGSLTLTRACASSSMRQQQGGQHGSGLVAPCRPRFLLAAWQCVRLRLCRPPSHAPPSLRSAILPLPSPRPTSRRPALPRR